MAWLSGYDKRVKITIDSSKVGSTLTDFPVFMPIDSSVGLGNNDLTPLTDDLGSSTYRKKIAVTTSNGTTQCNVEIAFEDIANGVMELHVKVPSISSSVDTDLYLYWDSTLTVTDNTNVGDTGESAAQAVWDSSFAAVWHMGENYPDDVVDSTGNGNVAQPGPGIDANSQISDGKLNKAYNYAAADYQVVDDSGTLDLDQGFTMEAWVRSATMTTQSGWYIDKGNTGNDRQNYGMVIVGGELQSSYRNGAFHSRRTTDTPFTANNTWYHCVGKTTSAVASSNKLYVNGVERAAGWDSGDGTLALLTNNDDLDIGIARVHSAGLDGDLDEIRIHNTDRSESWVVASYHTQNDSFVTYGGLEPVSIDKPFLNGYDNRMKITIDSSRVDEDLIDFPVYIALNSSSGITDNDATDILTDLSMTTGSNTYAKKIAVTAADGVTVLWVEWDHILTGSDSGLHVKVPFVNKDLNTELYLYWDSTKAIADNDHVGLTGDAAAKEVWNAEYLIVHHLNEQDGSYYIPNSANRDTDMAAQPVGMDNTNLVSGLIGNGIEFNGSNEAYQDGVRAEYSSINEITIETLIYRESSNRHCLCQYGKDAGQSWGTAVDLFGTDANVFMFAFYNGAWRSCKDTGTLSNDTWYHLAGTYDHVNMKVYRDGDLKTATPYTGNFQYNSLRGLRIGAYQATPSSKSYFFDGIVDELRISRVPRTAGWINATNHTLFDNFVSISDTETSSNPPAPNDLSAADWLTGYDKRIRVNVDYSLIDEDLTDFPIHVSINSSSGPDSVDLTEITDDLASSGNRKKIAVTTADGETQCWVEIEHEDIAGGVLDLNVKVPSVYKDSDTLLHLYWSSTGAVANNTYVGDIGEAAGENVWDSNFVGVWHLEQEPSGANDVKESTGTNVDGTTTNLVTANWIDTPLGKGYEYDQTPTREYVECAYSSNMGFTDYITLESFDRFDNAARTAERQIDSGDQANNKNPFALLPLSGKPGFSYRGTDSTFYTYDADVAQIVADEWAHFAAVHTNLDGSKTATFFNGTRLAGAWQSGTGDVSRASAYDHLRFGSGRSTADPWQMIGAQSEIRISNSVRSDAWLKATSETMHDNLVGYGMTLTVPTEEASNNPDWLTGWDGSRLQIQIDHSLVDGPLTDFPIMIVVGGASGSNEVDIRDITEDLASDANRKKIAFLDEGGNKLYAEIEEDYDVTLNRLLFHVKVPAVYSAINTVLYVYWDSAHASELTYIGDLGDTPAQAVWDSNYVGVWHMYKDAADNEDLHDSTGTIPDMAHGTSEPSESDGYPYNKSKAVRFNKDLTADNNHYSVDDQAEHNVGSNVTVEALTRRVAEHNNLAGAVAQLGKNQGQSYGLIINQPETSVNNNKMMFGFYASAWHVVTDPTAMETDKWYYYAGMYDGANMNLYRNDVLADTLAGVWTIDYTTVYRWNFGVYSVTYITWQSWFQGTTAEVRLSDIARAAEWTKATYHALFDTLLIYDEAGPEGAPSVPPFEPDAGDTYTPYNATELTIDGDWYQNNGTALVQDYWHLVGGPIPQIDAGWHLMAEPLEQDTAWQITTENAQDSGWNIQTAVTPQDVEWMIIHELKQETGWNILTGVIGFIQEFSMKCINFVFDVEEINAHCVDETDDVKEMVAIKTEFGLKNSHQFTFEITRVINENVFYLN